ncbi:MAG: hypothetical protein ABL929_12130 [Ferruginibacter sp.]|nr:hypothetical protein [Ferruginibacter sp.]
MNKNTNTIFWKYAGLTTQFFFAVGLTVFIGIKADKWLHFTTPIFVWLLPLTIIISIIFKIIKDTSSKK